MKKIGILGSGVVGKTLGAGFLKLGYEVQIGTREPAKLADWLAANPGAHVGDFAATAAFGDTILLAGKGIAAQSILALAGADNLNSKIIMDATNPIAEEPPFNGVLSFFTEPNVSLMEQLQAAFPDARFVKVFNSVGAYAMVNPKLPDRPTMFISGNSNEAKAEVRQLLDQLGWDAEDMGGAEAARAIEPLCRLWCIPGFRNNQWNHAFKLLRPVSVS
ncbi:MAG: DNA-binding protein [Bacteroidetes bacterium]|nr:DNA-binding protein [Bacteroidota bacterium]